MDGPRDPQEIIPGTKDSRDSSDVIGRDVKGKDVETLQISWKDGEKEEEEEEGRKERVNN